MSIKTIPCGGFKYDDSTVEFVDGAMKAKGAGESDFFIVKFDITDNELNSLMNTSFVYDIPVECNRSFDEITNAMINGKTLVGVLENNKISMFRFDANIREATDMGDYAVPAFYCVAVGLGLFHVDYMVIAYNYPDDGDEPNWYIARKVKPIIEQEG